MRTHGLVGQPAVVFNEYIFIEEKDNYL